MTAEGQQLVQLSIPVIRDIEAAWESQLGQTRMRQLRRILTALRAITDPRQQPRE